jgi:cupin 2 domain-containing protein
MALEVRNLFAELTAMPGGEESLTLWDNASTQIERIVSHSHSSPAGFWYDQPGDEWVVILRGSATLEFAEGKSVNLGAGDYLTIARHVRHRIARTDEETIWLAVRLK